MDEITALRILHKDFVAWLDSEVHSLVERGASENLWLVALDIRDAFTQELNHEHNNLVREQVKKLSQSTLTLSTFNAAARN